MFSRLRSNIVVLWIVRLLALPVIVLLYVAGFVLNLLYGICGSIGMVLAGLGGFAAFLALLDGSYAQAAASALVALLLSNQIFASRYVLYMPNKEQLIKQVEEVLNRWHSHEGD